MIPATECSVSRTSIVPSVDHIPNPLSNASLAYRYSKMEYPIFIRTQTAAPRARDSTPRPYPRHVMPASCAPHVRGIGYLFWVGFMVCLRFVHGLFRCSGLVHGLFPGRSPEGGGKTRGSDYCHILCAGKFRVFQEFFSYPEAIECTRLSGRKPRRGSCVTPLSSLRVIIQEIYI